MESHETPRMPDFTTSTDAPNGDEDVELVDIGVKIQQTLKDQTQENIRNAHGGRIRGVYRQEVENALVLRNYLFEEGIDPYQAIERLEVYKNLMPIEGELRQLSEQMEGAGDIEGELSEMIEQFEELNENISGMSEEFSRLKVQLDRMEYELSQTLYSDTSDSSDGE